MSGKVNLYAPFAGVKDGLTLLTLLQDKKKLAEVLGVVKILDEKIAEINEAMEAYGKASKIDVLLRVTTQNNQESKVILADAHQKAREIFASAEGGIRGQLEAVSESTKEIAARETVLKDGEARFKAGVAAAEKKMAEREAAVRKHEDAATQKMAVAEELKRRHGDALEDMKARAEAA